MADAMNFSLCREQQRKRKERTGPTEECEEHYSGFRAPDWPSCEEKRRMYLDQRRWNGKIVVFFERNQRCTFAERN